MNSLEHDSNLITEWFENSFMKLNQDKCHLLISEFKYKNVRAKIEKTKIWESKKQKLLVVEIDRILSFHKYIASLCRKSEKKLSVLARLSFRKEFDENSHWITTCLLPFNVNVPQQWCQQ